MTKIFHSHLGFADCNCGDKWLAMGAKTLIMKNLDIKREDIIEKRGILDDADLIRFYNPAKYDLCFIGGGGWLGETSPLWSGDHTFINWINVINSPYVIYGIGLNWFRKQEPLISEITTKPYLDNLREIQNKSKFFGIRRDGSQELLERGGFSCDKVWDPGFWCKPYLKGRKYDRKPYVIINTAGDCLNDRYTNGIWWKDFSDRITKLTEYLAKKGYRVYYSQLVTTDGLGYSYLPFDPEHYRLLTYREMLERGLDWYANAKFSIAMRGHAQIVPIGLEVPTISISTQSKNLYLMHELGLHKYNIDITDTDLYPKLQELVDEFIANPETIKEIYRTKLESMYKETEKDFDKIKGNLEWKEVLALNTKKK